MTKKMDFLKTFLFIVGSFSFGWVLGLVLHELGHAVAMWVTGGVVTRITINPFSWSYTYFGSNPKYPGFVTWAGMLLGSLFGLLALLVVGRKPSPYSAPFFLAGIAPMLNGGGYYWIDTFITKRGDPTDLINLGTPPFVVLGAALLIALLGVYFTVRFVYLTGIAPEDGFWTRAMLLGGGMAVHFMFALAYSFLYRPEDILQHVLAILMVTIFGMFLAFMTTKYPNLVKRGLSIKVEWRHVIYADVMAILAVAIPFLWFAVN